MIREIHARAAFPRFYNIISYFCNVRSILFSNNMSSSLPLFQYHLLSNWDLWISIHIIIICVNRNTFKHFYGNRWWKKVNRLSSKFMLLQKAYNTFLFTRIGFSSSAKFDKRITKRLQRTLPRWISGKLNNFLDIEKLLLWYLNRWICSQILILKLIIGCICLCKLWDFHVTDILLTKSPPKKTCRDDGNL